MELSRLVGIAVFLSCLLTASEATGLNMENVDHSQFYNHTLAKILVEYASAVYMSDLSELFTWTCTRCCDKIKDFDIIELIVDVQNCLQAFVGYSKDLNSIVIAFRGTQELSIQNWIEDLFWKQLDLNYPGMPDAMVHHGFYSAYHNTTIRPGILKAVKLAKKLYGDIGIIATGHSMGAAMASFVNFGETDVQVMTFGQPRVGNAVFASYYTEHVPDTIRVTNSHDIVPHLPPFFSFFPQKTYHHFPREVWLYTTGLESLVYSVEKICDGSGEDPTCSRSVTGNSISDHLSYFGVDLRADAPGLCLFWTGKLGSNMQADLHGNFVISKDPMNSVLRSRTQSVDAGSY